MKNIREYSPRIQRETGLTRLEVDVCIDVLIKEIRKDLERGEVLVIPNVFKVGTFFRGAFYNKVFRKWSEAKIIPKLILAKDLAFIMAKRAKKMKKDDFLVYSRNRPRVKVYNRAATSRFLIFHAF